MRGFVVWLMAALAGSIGISGIATAAGWQDFSQDAKSAVRNAVFTKSEGRS